MTTILSALAVAGVVLVAIVTWISTNILADGIIVLVLVAAIVCCRIMDRGHGDLYQMEDGAIVRDTRYGN